MSNKNYALTFAVLLLGLALGGEIVRRLPGRAAGASSRGPRVRVAAQTLTRVEYDHLIGLLGLPAGSSAAEHVIRELSTNRRLLERWKRVVRQNPDEARGVLLEELADDESFEALLARLKGDPEFEGELEPARLAAKREAERDPAASSSAASDGSRMLLADEDETARRGSAAPGRPLRAGSRAPQLRPGRLSRARERAVSAAGPVGQARAVGPSAAVAGHGPVGEPERTVTHHPGAAATEDGPARAAGRANAGQGPDAHEVRARLATIDAATSPQMARLLEQYPWLTGLTDAERADVFRYTAEDGLWGACFRLGIYQRCANACAQAGASCVPLDGWRACLDFQDGNTATCATLCAQQPGCAPPGGATGATTGGATTGGDGGAGACPYAGRSCQDICSAFEEVGPCGPGCIRYSRSCPADSACDVSVRQTPGESPSQTSMPCP